MALSSLPPIAKLELATVTLPDWHPEAANSRTVPVYGYAVDHPDGTILFDTGVGVGNAFIDEVYEPRVDLLDRSLDSNGFSVDAVVAIVNSHLHFDHCGQNPLFFGTDTPVFSQQAEIENVERAPHYTDAAWALAPDPQRRPIDGDLEIAEGVTIMATPGHTSGHQSLLVEAGRQRVVIAGQAVWHSREFVDEIATSSNADTDELRNLAVDSIRRIKALRPEIVYFSHCSEHRSQPDSSAARHEGPARF